MLCLHRYTMEGGSLPAGRWCQSCGAKIVKRGSKVEQALADKEREQRAAQQFERVRRELARKSRP